MSQTHPNVSSGFEGPEKRLEVDFKTHPTSSLLSVSTERWQSMLDYAKCTIISTMQNEHCTCYVLSESSLFVYPHKVMLKTCGTTTLLNAIPDLLDIASSLDLEPEFVMFSRKNYLFPDCQLSPHGNFTDETAHLNSYFNGHSYILGPVTGDHWYVYLADLSPNSHTSGDATLEVLMHDIPAEICEQFVRNADFVDAKTVTRSSGIEQLIPDSQIDDFAFDPCGYSMNGLNDKAYWTIHITPEHHCSFISFETNLICSSRAYQKLILKVIETFRPGRFQVSLFADDHALDASTLHILPTKLPSSKYKLDSKAYYEFPGGYNLTLCNFFHSSNAEPLTQIL